MARWRRGGEYAGVTPISRKLLQHWADPSRENRVLFCQREAAETAIFLTEVAGRSHGYADWRKRLEPQNAAHNDGLPRIALKVATGSGKTVVMAMLLAWQTLNKVQSPRDQRFTNRFLVVTPGITIKDRLRVLLPEDQKNYYGQRDLIPSDLKGGLEHARIVITNYHAFQLKDAKEIKGVAKNTRLLLKGDRAEDAFRETPKAMVSRVLRDLGGTSAAGKQQIMVFNDEAHHCYQDKPVSANPNASKLSRDQKEDNVQARVWFRGLQAIARRELLEGKVGPSLPPDEYQSALVEAKRRVDERIPPGYMDAEKEGPDGSAGDYLVWHQSVLEAKGRGLPLIIVTGDEKEDWWWRHRSALMGPRSELIDEYLNDSQRGLVLIRPVQLIDHASVLDVTVSEEAASDVARGSVTATTSRWTSEAVHELLRRLDAEGAVQAEVVRFAASQGGIIDREKIYELGGYGADRMLRGFTRPTARLTRELQAEGFLGDGVERMLKPIYQDVIAVKFEIPLDVVELLAGGPEDGPI